MQLQIIGFDPGEGHTWNWQGGGGGIHQKL